MEGPPPVLRAGTEARVLEYVFTHELLSIFANYTISFDIPMKNEAADKRIQFAYLGEKSENIL